MEEIKTFLDIDKDKIMNENGIFQLGSFHVKPGERVSGFLSLVDGEFQLPVTILNGEEPGKTVLITAGIHAEEYVGIGSMQKNM